MSEVGIGQKHPLWKGEAIREQHHYVPLRRDCDDPEKTFERNRGKWTNEPSKPIAKKLVSEIAPACASKGGNNPNNWKKCA